MSVSRTLAISRKSLSQLANDRRTVGFVLVVPLILIIVFGYGFGGTPTHIAVVITNLDTGSAGARILADLPSGTLDATSVGDASGAYQAVSDGSARAAIVIPANFSSALLAGNASVTVDLDGSSPTIVAAVLGAIQGALQKTLGGSAGSGPVHVAPVYVYGSADATFIDTLAPGMMALVAVFATTILAILVLVREKSQGILERLFATPLRPIEFVLGHGVSLVLVGAAQTTVVLLASVFIFHATFVGSIPLAYVLLMLFALGNIGLGMLISALAQSEFQAVQLIPLLIFPQLLFSGALFPVETIPLSFRPISTVLPLTYAADAMHAVLLRGWGIRGSVVLDVIALAAYAALTLGAATALVRRQR